MLSCELYHEGIGTDSFYSLIIKVRKRGIMVEGVTYFSCICTRTKSWNTSIDNKIIIFHRKEFFLFLLEEEIFHLLTKIV